MNLHRWRQRLVTSIATLGLLGGAFVAVPTTISAVASESVKTIKIAADNQTVLHNPGMGWLMYVEEFGDDLPDPAVYWQKMEPYLHSASGLYLRVPWSRLEPEEGKYAWDNDPKWQGLVQGAIDRGLALTFRVYKNSEDAHVQATPEFVFQAGAEVQKTNGRGFKDTYANDPVFMKKYENFVQAFGKKYGDPRITDFVDINTIGAWGEMHGAVIKPGGLSWGEVVDWLHATYKKAFPHTMIVMNYAAADEDNMAAFDRSINDGAAMRRDGIGSVKWLRERTLQKIKENRNKSIFIAENCYQAFTKWARSCDEGFKPLDKMTERVVNQALDLHANYLDLRKDIDVIYWNTQQPQLVKKFALQGGYRIAPSSVTVGEEALHGRQAPVEVTWNNSAVGRIPNNLHGWKGRFSVAYRVIDKAGKTVATVQSKVDPGTFTSAEPVKDTITLPALARGNYTLQTAIVDRERNGEPGIKLAVAGVDDNQPPQWVTLDTLAVDPVKDTAATTAQSGDAKKTGEPTASKSASQNGNVGVKTLANTGVSTEAMGIAALAILMIGAGLVLLKRSQRC